MHRRIAAGFWSRLRQPVRHSVERDGGGFGAPGCAGPGGAFQWRAVTNTPTANPTERSVQLPLTGNAKLFRLRKP